MDIEKRAFILKQEIAIINDKITAMERRENSEFELHRLQEQKKELEKELSDLYPDILA